MPRMARIRKDGAYYHIMCHSISEMLLFRDDTDKIKYLKILRRTLIEFDAVLLSYSLMDNHLHLLINPVNSDISKFMKKLNVSYAMYYNVKYNRKGSVFAGRFKSKIIDSEQYFLIVSLYIHNNSKDIGDLTITNSHEYRFSSFSYYLGYSKDEFNIITKDIILSFLDSNPKKAIILYKNLNNIYNNLTENIIIKNNKLDNIISEENISNYINKFNKENSYEYISGKHIRLVNVDPQEILNAVSSYFNLPSCDILRDKYNRSILDYKAICCIMLRSLCDLTRRQICYIFGNITVSNVYSLCLRGIELLKSKYNREQIYNNIISLT